MKINTSYPYPVLFEGNDDYKNSSFETKYDLSTSFGDIQIHVSFQLQNEEIQKLVDVGLCTYAVHLESPLTSFRKLYKTTDKQLKIAIPESSLRGKVTMHSFIIANTKIEGYQNDKLSSWFTGAHIIFETGNLLAIGNAIETDIMEDQFELMDLPSIMKVRSAKGIDVMEVDFSSNDIVIALPEKEYMQYATHANSILKNTVLTMVIFPALTYVFSRISDSDVEEEGYVWYRVLEKKFEENGYSIQDVGTDELSALKAAQLILRKPLQGSFLEIEKHAEMEDE